MVELDAIITEGSPLDHLMELTNALSDVGYKDPGDGLGAIHGMPCIKLTSVLFEYLLAQDLVDSVADDNKAKPLAKQRLEHYRPLISGLTTIVVEHRETLKSELQSLGKDVQAHPFSCILAIIEHAADYHETRKQRYATSLNETQNPTG